MAMPWYEWRNVRERLLTYGKALQGVSAYRVVLEPDRAKCPSGYTNYTTRLIMVNPAMFEVPAPEQYQLTKAVLCHEAGHWRFTTPEALPPHVHLVSNILEDERIERLMEEEFAGVRALLKKLATEMLKEARPLDPASDDPVHVLNYLLQRRWSLRAGLPVRGDLSQRNWECWELIVPLVEEAWTADSSIVCHRNAEEILRLLGIGEPDIPQWLRELLEKLEAVEGERGKGDVAETGAPKPVDGSAGHEGDEPFDGEPVPHEHGAGPDAHRIDPALSVAGGQGAAPGAATGGGAGGGCVRAAAGTLGTGREAVGAAVYG